MLIFFPDRYDTFCFLYEKTVYYFLILDLYNYNELNALKFALL